MASAFAGGGSYPTVSSPSAAMRSSSRPVGSRNPFLDPELIHQAQHQQSLPAGDADTIMAESGQEPQPSSRVDDLSQAFSAANISQRNSSMPLDSSPSLGRSFEGAENADGTTGESSAATAEARGIPPPLPQRRQRRSGSSDRLHSNQESWIDAAGGSSSSPDVAAAPTEGSGMDAMSPAYNRAYSSSPGSSRITSSGVPTVPGSDYPEPTSTPTPGRPLLRDGKLMLMPPSWESCAKCQGTGYKHADPSQPHDSCWRSYGRHYTPALVTSSDVLDRAMLLQRPLPMCVRPGNFPPPALPVSASSTSGQRTQSSPYSPPPPRRVSSGAMYSAGPTLNPNRNPSITVQQQQQQRRRSPPRVNRAADANEGGEDPQGEAPPAYEDVVRVPQNVQLPPQRNGEGGPSTTGSASRGGPPSRNDNGRGSSPSGRQQQHAPPTDPPPPPSRRGETFGYPHGLPQHHSYGGSSSVGPNGPNSWFAYPQSHTHAHHPPPMFAFGSPVPAPSVPPVAPAPIVYQAGDPRLGGVLCHKCGGSGIRESLFFGDETCSRCSGIGRVR